MFARKKLNQSLCIVLGVVSRALRYYHKLILQNDRTRFTHHTIELILPLREFCCLVDVCNAGERAPDAGRT